MYNVYYTSTEEGGAAVKVRMFVLASSKAEAYAEFKQECIDAGKWNRTLVVKIEPHEEYGK